MNYSNLLKIAFVAIAANKMRSFLTALGIIIGVASVITMLAIGQGSKKSIQANIAEMGSNMIMIQPGADMRGGVRQDASSMETLKLNDYTSIKEECNYVKGVSPTVQSSGQWIYGNNNTPSSIYGVSQDYFEIRQLSISDGEMFTDADIKASAKVCILGQTVIDNLFPDGNDPIGKVIRFNSIPFRVIGVLKKKGYNSFGMDQDNLVIAPYTTVMKRIMAQTYLGGITCSAVTEGVTDKAIEEITTILRRNHKLKEGTEEMEGDAVAQICQTYDVPFLSIRVISNTVFEGDIINAPGINNAIGVVRFGNHPPHVSYLEGTSTGFYIDWKGDHHGILRTDIGYWLDNAESIVIGNIHDNPKMIKRK